MSKLTYAKLVEDAGENEQVLTSLVTLACVQLEALAKRVHALSDETHRHHADLAREYIREIDAWRTFWYPEETAANDEDERFDADHKRRAYEQMTVARIFLMSYIKTDDRFPAFQINQAWCHINPSRHNLYKGWTGKDVPASLMTLDLF